MFFRLGASVSKFFFVSFYPARENITILAGAAVSRSGNTIICCVFDEAERMDVEDYVCSVIAADDVQLSFFSKFNRIFFWIL